jgi:hypothetical protein
MALRFSVTSRYASSSYNGSMIGVYAANISRICREMSIELGGKGRNGA